MKHAYDAANAFEAHMRADLLKQEGIEAHIRGECLQGAVGEVHAAGMVACYAFLRAPVQSDGFDHNGDGILDDRWVQSASDSPLRFESDRNLDGKVDHDLVMHLTHGALSSYGVVLLK